MMPSRMIGASLTQEIRATPETVWETVTDRNSQVFVSNVIERELITQGDVAVGTVVREVRNIHGKHPVESYTTITAISNTLPYSISSNVHLTKSSALNNATSDALRTGGWTIVQGANEKCSVFVWTYSAIAEGFWASLATLCCGPCLIRGTKDHFEQDLKEYAAEAERRQGIKDALLDSAGGKHL